MRVVFDTNILVSFAIRPNRALERMFDHIAVHGRSLVSEDTIDELFDVLSRDKFRKYIPLNMSLDFIDWYVGISEQVLVTDKIVACRDPKDDKFLALAVSGRADCIVAGDLDLVEMVQFDGVAVFRPSDFLSRFVR